MDGIGPRFEIPAPRPLPQNPPAKCPAPANGSRIDPPSLVPSQPTTPCSLEGSEISTRQDRHLFSAYRWWLIQHMRQHNACMAAHNHGTIQAEPPSTSPTRVNQGSHASGPKTPEMSSFFLCCPRFESGFGPDALLRTTGASSAALDNPHRVSPPPPDVLLKAQISVPALSISPSSCCGLGALPSCAVVLEMQAIILDQATVLQAKDLTNEFPLSTSKSPQNPPRKQSTQKLREGGQKLRGRGHTYGDGNAPRDASPTTSQNASPSASPSASTTTNSPPYSLPLPLPLALSDKAKLQIHGPKLGRLSPSDESKHLMKKATGKRISRRRRGSELAEHERRYCPYGCGKFYRKTSHHSIQRHLSLCINRFTQEHERRTVKTVPLSENKIAMKAAVCGQYARRRMYSHRHVSESTSKGSLERAKTSFPRSSQSEPFYESCRSYEDYETHEAHQGQHQSQTRTQTQTRERRPGVFVKDKSSSTAFRKRTALRTDFQPSLTNQSPPVSSRPTLPTDLRRPSFSSRGHQNQDPNPMANPIANSMHDYTGSTMRNPAANQIAASNPMAMANSNRMGNPNRMGNSNLMANSNRTTNPMTKLVANRVYHTDNQMAHNHLLYNPVGNSMANPMGYSTVNRAFRQMDVPTHAQMPITHTALAMPVEKSNLTVAGSKTPPRQRMNAGGSSSKLEFEDDTSPLTSPSMSYTQPHHPHLDHQSQPQRLPQKTHLTPTTSNKWIQAGVTAKPAHGEDPGAKPTSGARSKAGSMGGDRPFHTLGAMSGFKHDDDGDTTQLQGDSKVFTWDVKEKEEKPLRFHKTLWRRYKRPNDGESEGKGEGESNESNKGRGRMKSVQGRQSAFVRVSGSGKRGAEVAIVPVVKRRRLQIDTSLPGVRLSAYPGNKFEGEFHGQYSGPVSGPGPGSGSVSGPGPGSGSASGSGSGSGSASVSVSAPVSRPGCFLGPPKSSERQCGTRFRGEREVGDEVVCDVRRGDWTQIAAERKSYTLSSPTHLATTMGRREFFDYRDKGRESLGVESTSESRESSLPCHPALKTGIVPETHMHLEGSNMHKYRTGSHHPTHGRVQCYRNRPWVRIAPFGANAPRSFRSSVGAQYDVGSSFAGDRQAFEFRTSPPELSFRKSAGHLFSTFIPGDNHTMSQHSGSKGLKRPDMSLETRDSLSAGARVGGLTSIRHQGRLAGVPPELRQRLVEKEAQFQNILSKTSRNRLGRVLPCSNLEPRATR